MRTRNVERNIERRSTILNAASDLFVERGFHSTSMKDICVAASMSPGTVYHYFNSKTEIIAGIVEEEGKLMRGFALEIAGQENFTAALFATLDSLVHHLTERDLALHAEITAELTRQPELLAKARLADDTVLKILADTIRQAQKAERLDAALEPEATAVMIGALIDGLLWRATLRGINEFSSLLPPLKRAIARLLGVADEAP
jgi:AcrR family transcriptional regulator